MAETPPLSFGQLLRRHRRAAELTQEELAERAGLSPRTVSDLERGLYLRPHRDTVRLLADALTLTGDDRAAFLEAGRSRGSALDAPGPDRGQTQRPEYREKPVVQAQAVPAQESTSAEHRGVLGATDDGSTASVARPGGVGAVPEERRLVTVLFADVTGSTALGEDLDPEDIRALMSRYYDHARRVISEHGGTLEKFIGDAVMAVFGLPRAHGDDAERAAATALALRTAVEEDVVLRERVTLRIGVNTGEVVATSDPSHGDFLVTGDAVNVAARLQQSAAEGEILIGGRTHAATAAAFLFAEGRRIEAKGKREPLVAFPLVGVRPTRHVERPLLVGRKRELGHLALLRSWTLEEKRPQLVSLVAPAGTGKTRLLEEFLAAADPDEGWRVAIGRCPPYGRALTYWPLRGLLEDLAGGIERDLVIDTFLRGGQSQADASRLADLVLAPLGIEGETLTEREAIFATWRLLVETLAKESPRVVVFEDLHWASDSLLDLVEHVMQPRTRAPLLLVAISRPELLDRRPAWGGGRQSFTALALDPLTAAQTAVLVEQLGGGLPEALRRRIAERSGGNPFFATELVRGLAERGIGTGSPEPDVVPDTVQAAVLARLDRLPPIERSVVQAASVAGRAFSPALLAAVLPDLDMGAIETALEGLLARDLAVSGEGETFTFRHVLIRDVAYGTLSRTERIRMHTAVARWLEEDASGRLDEFVELIAYHYREAVQLARRSTLALSLPIDTARAIHFLERAGAVASRAGTLAEARRYLETAVGLAPEDRRMGLYERLGDCAVWGDAALDAYREAFRRWEGARVGGPLMGGRLLRKMLIIHMRWLDTTSTRPGHDEMVKTRAEARRLAEEAGDEDELWRVKVADLFWPHWRLWTEGGELTPGEEEEGLTTALAAAEYFERRGEWEAFSEALDGYAGVARMAGRVDRLIEASERRLSVPRLAATERGDALSMVIWGHNWLGQYDRAVDLARELLAQIPPGEPLIHVGGALGMAAAAAFHRGRWSDLDDFLALAREVREQAPEGTGFAYGEGAYWAALHVAVARDDRAAVDRSIAVLTRGIDLEEGDTQAASRAWLTAVSRQDPCALDLELIGRVHAADPFDLGQSLMVLNEHGVRAPDRLIRQVMEQARKLSADAPLRWAQIATALASGNTTALARAIDEAEEHGLVPHAARMRIVLARMTGDPAPLEEARPVLERLGDRRFLRRLEEVAGSRP